ncbi:MAG: hypothetical protein LBV06_01825 [Propionibacteriaceae bacterium]|jgi:hypothetical protein|nr:hypothetical protein [Propionibacteriaceae bacterium]
MTNLMIGVDWWALLQVTVVTIVASAAIAGLMSLANWFWTPATDSEQPTRSRKAVGWVLMGVMGVIVLGGLYLIIPYFH